MVGYKVTSWTAFLGVIYTYIERDGRRKKAKSWDPQHLAGQRGTQRNTGPLSFPVMPSASEPLTAARVV